MRLLAPAKINLHLRVGKRRDDGFHPLLTWMCTVGLFDTLTLEATADLGTEGPGLIGSPPATGRAGEPTAADVLRLRFDCDRPGLPRDEGNLVVRIATAFAAEVYAPPPPGGGVLSAGVGGATGSRARNDGGDGGGAAGSAGAARVEAPGMGDARRSASVQDVVAGTKRGAGAARDAEWPVRTDDLRASGPAEGHGRERAARAAPAAPTTSATGSTTSNDVAAGGGGGGFGAGIRVARVGITLAKRIPVGAGLGGGSSDAARTLVGLNRLWEAGRAADALSDFAARFGSDVPFFVAAAYGAPSAACAGRGEIIRRIPRPAQKWALLVLPPFPLATRDVYARFDEMGLGSDGEVAGEPHWQAWATLPALRLLPRLVNDLEPPAFSLSPRLASLRRRAEEVAGRPVRMSGSGSSLFTLYDAGEEAEARAAAERMGRLGGFKTAVTELAPDLGDDLL